MQKRRKRIGLAVLGIVLVVLILAWIDGGRESLRPIVMPVPLADGASGAAR